MSLDMPAMVTAGTALRLSLARMDRAARAVSRASLASRVDPGPSIPTDRPPAPPESPMPGRVLALDLDEAMLTMMIAQRSALAQLRMLETQDAMQREVVDLKRHAAGR